MEYQWHDVLKMLIYSVGQGPLYIAIVPTTPFLKAVRTLKTTGYEPGQALQIR